VANPTVPHKAHVGPPTGAVPLKRNLYELLGRPLTKGSSEVGTVYTATPETHDEGGGLDLLAGLGTTVTFEQETHDDDTVLTSLADHVGTFESRDDGETYDDDTVLLSLTDHVGTFVTKSDETYDDDAMLPGL